MPSCARDGSGRRPSGLPVSLVLQIGAGGMLGSLPAALHAACTAPLAAVGRRRHLRQSACEPAGSNSLACSHTTLHACQTVQERLAQCCTHLSRFADCCRRSLLAARRSLPPPAVSCCRAALKCRGFLRLRGAPPRTAPISPRRCTPRPPITRSRPGAAAASAGAGASAGAAGSTGLGLGLPSVKPSKASESKSLMAALCSGGWALESWLGPDPWTPRRQQAARRGRGLRSLLPPPVAAPPPRVARLPFTCAKLTAKICRSEQGRLSFIAGQAATRVAPARRRLPALRTHPAALRCSPALFRSLLTY